MAGARTPNELTVEELLRLIRDAGFRPIQRDSVYEVLRSWEPVADAALPSA